MNRLLIAIIVLTALALSGGTLAADAAAGKEKSQLCAGCHGPDGNTPMMPEYPKLAGQPADYLEKVLRDYKKGARKNPMMMPMAQGLSKRDIKDLAAYYSSLKGDLKVK
ncbi:MAG TPA: cytochrome c [Burkholderiales bacterium]|nr:cytochrome c [Burkholderiales bacterium]